MSDPIDYTASYHVIANLRYVCQLAEMLLFPKEEELTASGHDEYQVFQEIKIVLYENMDKHGATQFWLLNHENCSIENLYMDAHDTVIRETFIKEVNLRMSGLSPILEQLVSQKNWKVNITQTFDSLSEKLGEQRGNLDIGYEVCQAIEEAVTLLQTMDRLSSVEKQKVPTEATLEEWFPEEQEKWIRFIGEQLARRSGKQGKFVALLLCGLHKVGRMDKAYNNKDRRKTVASLQRVLDNKFPGKIGSEQAIQKYLAPMYNEDSNSQYKLHEDEIADMKKAIQKYK